MLHYTSSHLTYWITELLINLDRFIQLQGLAAVNGDIFSSIL